MEGDMYETWLLIAFSIWLMGVIWFFVSINSQFERNLRKVDLRLSWVTLAPKLVDTDVPEPGWVKKLIKFSCIYGIGLISVVLGPLYVAFAVGAFAYARWKDSGVPASVKEVRWRLRNQDLQPEEIRVLIQDHMTVIRLSK